MDYKINSNSLTKRINNEKDVIHFKTKSPAYKNILTCVELLCDRIYGTSNKIFNRKYTVKHETFRKCCDFIDLLQNQCQETDLKLNQGASSLRFGHVAFRDWFDSMKSSCQKFIDELASTMDNCYRDELFTYLSESFGNKMRIDYGTGHELSFIVFTMGLMNLVDTSSGDIKQTTITNDKLKVFIEVHGWDIHHLFAHKYLRLCRMLQIKFRLEPAGSRGVYNMDDFQYLPFLFGAAQISGVKYIPVKGFYEWEQVDQFKDDYIFFEAVDFILNNKRGPFNEHSYTLWNFTNLGSWEIIFRRIKFKFTDDILGPFPIIQHFLFGQHILKWDPDEHEYASQTDTSPVVVQ